MVFPALIFAYAWLYTARELPWLRRIAKTLRESLPYVGLSLGYLAMRFAVLKTVAVSVSKLSSGPTFATVPSLLVFYVRLLLWPVGLSPLYNMPAVRQAGFENFYLPLLLLVLPVLILYLSETLGGDCRYPAGIVSTLVWAVAEKERLRANDAQPARSGPSMAAPSLFGRVSLGGNRHRSGRVD